MKFTQLPVLKITIYIICALVGALFLFSAYTKIFPIEYFEYTFIDLGFANWYTAPFFARLMIGIEGFIGVLLIFQVRMKKFSIPLAVIVLLVFCVHLAGQLLLNGNRGNCGCFGNYLVMTPLEALIKNILLLGLLGIAYAFYQGGWQLNRIIVLVAGIAILAVPFIVNPVDLSVSVSHDEDALNYPLDVHWLYDNPNDVSPSVDLNKDKHILAYLSLTCPHCKLAAYKFHVMYKRNPSLPIQLILNGDKEDLPVFYNETKADNVPAVLFKGPNFLKMSGPNLPSIYWIKNDTVVKKSTYLELNQEEIEEWVKEK